MVNNHTPGPWVIDPCWDIIAINDVDGGCNGSVAEVIHHPNINIRAANARLIAAAPELLQALAGLVAAKDSVTTGQERELYAEWLPKARAAIAKATGEA